MARKYHSLLLRTDGRWGVEFGDYDRQCVADERDEYSRDYPARDLKIITTGDAQADINAAVEKLNDWRTSAHI